MSLILAENIQKYYQVGEIRVTALKGVSFEIETSSADTDVLHLDRKGGASFRGSNISFIFQDFNLIPVLTVYENIEYPLLMVQSVPASEREKRVNALLEAVGMAEQKNKYPDQISGGKGNG